MLGIRRGTIAAVDDPEQMFRYKVRVDGINFPSTPASALRWAECCTVFAAFGTGDIPHFEIGDRVWVGFENDSLDQPVILGGWIAKRRGLSDISTDITQDYASSRRKWVRSDRIGNMVEMSEVPGERQVRLRSGSAELIVTQRDDSITLSASGEIRVNAGRAIITSKAASVSSESITLSALSDGSGVINLVADSDINLHVRPAGDAINIGQHIDSGSITSGGVPTPRQSPKVTVFASDVYVGQYDSPTLLPTVNVRIAASAEVSIRSATQLTLEAPNVSVTGSVAVVGTVSATGNVASQGTVSGLTDVVGGAASVSLVAHRHVYTDTPAGPSITQPPSV